MPLYNDSITARTYNVERHFLTKHKDSLSTMMEDEKLEDIKKCVMQYTQQKNSLQQFVAKHHPSTKSSFIASLNKYGKLFINGEFFKNTFSKCKFII